MKMSCSIFFLLLFGMLLSTACTAGDAEATVTAVAVATASNIVAETAVILPSPTATSSPTLTPSPTATPLPTATPSPTITPSPSPPATPAIVYPTKEIFIQWGGDGGDGVDPTDFYYGRSTPSMVIYADGQMLIKDGGWRTTTFFETTLTSAEMCALRDEIAATGFLEPRDEEAYYTQHDGSEGAANVVVQVEDVLYYFYAPDVPYLTADLAAGLGIVRNFQPHLPADTAYVPEIVIFWGSEANLEWLTLYGYNDQPVAWPTAFPPLSEVWTDTTENQFVITGESVPFVYDWFDNTLTERIVQWGDMNYYIIARPLLPHETPDAFSNYPYPPTDYTSTLDCAE